MKIRRAVMSELPQIMAVYEYARDFMARTGNPDQWGKTHPTEAAVVEHIKNGNLYVVLQDGGIVGAFAFIPGIDPTYGYIEGNWNTDEPYSTIHCVASNGKVKGMFAKVVEYCEKHSRHLRIDTYKDNKIMQRAIEKQGFSYCGIIFLASGSPRLAYDRIK